MNLEDQIAFYAKACAEVTREVEEIAGENVCPENFHGILRAFANNVLEDEDVSKEKGEPVAISAVQGEETETKWDYYPVYFIRPEESKSTK